MVKHTQIENFKRESNWCD